MTLWWSDLSRRGRWGCAVVSAPTDALPPVSCEVFVQHVSHMHDWTETRESGRLLLTSTLRFLLPDTCKQEPRWRDNQCIHFTCHCIHSKNKYKWNKNPLMSTAFTCQERLADAEMPPNPKFQSENNSGRAPDLNQSSTAAAGLCKSEWSGDTCAEKSRSCKQAVRRSTDEQSDFD